MNSPSFNSVWEKVVIIMVNKIVLAVCTTVVMAASAKAIAWLNERFGDDNSDKKKR